MILNYKALESNGKPMELYGKLVRSDLECLLGFWVITKPKELILEISSLLMINIPSYFLDLII